MNFESDDRSRPSPAGTYTKLRVFTPLRDYRDFGPLHLAGYGEARWRLPEGEFTGRLVHHDGRAHQRALNCKGHKLRPRGDRRFTKTDKGISR